MIEIGARAAAQIAACLLVASAGAYALYRTTTPPTARPLRIALGLGRWAALFLVLLLAVDPAVWIKRTESSEPVVLVMVDDSGSMARPSVSAKLDAARAALSSGFLESLEEKADVRVFSFSDRAEEIGAGGLDALSAGGSRTDLVSGLEFALERLEHAPSDIVIVSDGGVNFGKDAVHFSMGIGVPVHTLSLAGAEPTPDLSIDRLEYSEMAYAGSDVPLEIYLSGRNLEAVETRLAVEDSAGAVHEEAVRVPGGGARIKKSVRINAGEAGVHRFTVTLHPFEGEEVTRNNRTVFSLRVIKGRIKALMVAAEPSWDFAFTRRNLMQDPNVDVFVHFIPGGARRVSLPNSVDRPEGRLGEMDAVVLAGDVDVSGLAARLKDFVSAGGGLLLLPGGSGALQLGEVNPLELEAGAAGGPREAQALVTDAGMAHEILNIGGTFRADLWADLPPLPVAPGVVGARREAVVLMRSDEDAALPVLAVRKYGSGKVAALACGELWRWDLATVGFGLDVPVYRGLLGSIVKWLVRREEAKRVTLASPRVDYQWGEPVDFVARVVDENLRGLPDAVISGAIAGLDSAGTRRALDFAERGAGNFSARTDFLPPGRYAARVEATREGGPVGSDALVFNVDGRGLEDMGFDGDDMLLEEISSVTGGRHYRIGAADSLAGEINPGEVVVNRLDEVRLELGAGTFALILVLLGAEWLVRKRRMLA